MTRKWGDLVRIIDNANKEGFELQIPKTRLERIIGQVMGVSNFTIKETLNALLRFGLITEASISVWDLHHPDKTPAQVEKEEVQKVDVVLEAAEPKEEGGVYYDVQV